MSNSSSLVRYLGSRLLLAPVMLWLIASLVFLLLRVAPGDPAVSYTHLTLPTIYSV